MFDDDGADADDYIFGKPPPGRPDLSRLPPLVSAYMKIAAEFRAIGYAGDSQPPRLVAMKLACIEAVARALKDNPDFDADAFLAHCGFPLPPDSVKLLLCAPLAERKV